MRLNNLHVPSAITVHPNLDENDLLTWSCPVCNRNHFMMSWVLEVMIEQNDTVQTCGCGQKFQVGTPANMTAN